MIKMWAHLLQVSFLELYNEELTDLMSFDSASSGDDAKKLRCACMALWVLKVWLQPQMCSMQTVAMCAATRLLEDKSGVVVQGLEEVIVRSAAEIYQVRFEGMRVGGGYGLDIGSCHVKQFPPAPILRCPALPDPGPGHSQAPYRDRKSVV